MVHIPVLSNEVIEGLKLREGDVVLDATLGGGGHAAELCGRLGRGGTLIGMDLDEEALRHARKKLEGLVCAVHLARENFKNLDTVLAALGVEKIDKALFDLGLSSFELETSGRGFSFRKDEPLLMTFNSSPGADALTAATIVNTWTEEKIADVLKEYGEERFARRIARAICEARKKKAITGTGELAKLVAESTPARFRRGDSPAKTFQALRIAVNDELGALREGLAKVAEFLNPGGRIAVISFHSLEDRIVKRYFRELAEEGAWKIITKKPIIPGEEEVSANTRARSAKLRIIKKLLAVSL